MHGGVMAVLCRVLAVTLVVGATALGPGAVEPALGGAVTATAADQGAVAASLARAVQHAGSAQARYNALLAVLRAAGIGVYSSRTGRVIVRGTERSRKDFFALDGEVRALAGALARGETWGTADLAGVLTALGVRPAGGAVDADTLREVLLAGVRAAAAHSAQLGSLVPLLVRALGQGHAAPYDMSREVPDEQLRLDALQLFLIEADLLLPIVQRVHGEAAATGPHLAALRLTRPAGSLPGQALRGPCSDIQNIIDAITKSMGLEDPVLKRFTGWQTAGWKKYAVAAAVKSSEALALAVAKLETLSANLDPAVPLINALHDTLMAFTVRVQRRDTVLTTHYGPPSHSGAPANAGRELRFRIKVDVQDDLRQSEEVTACFGFLGLDLKFPPPGPLAGVIVVWERTRELERYGTVQQPSNWQRFCPRAGLACSTTGGDGVATLVFRPKDEAFPGKGIVSIEHGSVTGLALYQAAFGHIPGQVAQLLIPKYDVIGWDVGRHAPLGFKFAHLKLKFDWEPGKCMSATARCVDPPVASGGCSNPADCDVIVKMHWEIDISGRVCGESPYVGYDVEQNLDTGLWEITERTRETTTFARKGPVTRSATFTYPWEITQAGAIGQGRTDMRGAAHSSYLAYGQLMPPFPRATFLESRHAHVAAAFQQGPPMAISYDLTIDQPAAFGPARQTARVAVEDDPSCPLPRLASTAPAP